MAKRFTDSEKWKRPWYRTLSLEAKVVWTYLLDNCDHAGIWVADFDLASFQVGFTFGEKDLQGWFKGKVVKVAEDKFCIPSYFDFQYGATKSEFKARISAAEILKRYGTFDESGNFVPTLYELLPNSTETLTEQSKDCLSISIGKSTSTSKSKTNDASKNPAFDFEAAYTLYPLKIGKAEALKRFKDQIKTQQDFDNLTLKAIPHYRAYLTRESWRKPKQFDTFLGTKASGFFWHDWIDSETGTEEKAQADDISYETECSYVGQAIQKFGSANTAEAKTWLGEDRWRAVKLIGWASLCRMPDDQFRTIAIIKALKETLHEVG